MKRWLLTYVFATQLLHRYGESAWPWNVHFVWSHARTEVDIALAEIKRIRAARKAGAAEDEYRRGWP
jgi:hypothetical protein